MKTPISKPTFCQKHMKIHVCDEQNIFKKTQTIEKKLSEKVRRLHGIQTEEEIIKRNVRSKPKPGTLEYILEKAKNKIDKEKKKINKNTKNEEVENKKIDETELTSRVEILKQKIKESTQTQEFNLFNKTTKKIKSPSSNSDTKKTKKVKLSSKKENNIYDINLNKDIQFLNKNDSTQEVSLNKLNNKIIKKVLKTDSENKNIDFSNTYTEEQTQELIKSTVEYVLKEVGYIKKPKKNNSK
ncbi:hypothetical protein SLITO_v1c04770 [Spiroplasma litorale]|uniref:Uncharacterized protein n=1 Tax=Spiroplasma litorale TaxID=216942 RepID=A0A0K1W1D0_9MOLU|nr:hypothetical protein [Spiroplasma litorale]AKX34130.1 hypothetical protein SLITO_v1c04770 [Spiroplasma litorale]